MSAVISDCGNYRYLLERKWGVGLPAVTWVMLNPSTADAEKDDPTIRRCIAFSKAWGYGSLFVVNLFAWRATDPEKLRRVLRPVGPENDHYIGYAACNCKEVVAAWGTRGTLQRRDIAVMKNLQEFPVRALGLTSAGHPKHPLYVAASTERITMQIEAAGVSPTEGPVK